MAPKVDWKKGLVPGPTTLEGVQYEAWQSGCWKRKGNDKILAEASGIGSGIKKQ